MSPKPKPESHPFAAVFLLSFLALLASLSYHSSQLTIKSLNQAKSFTFKSLNLHTLPINIGSALLTSTKNHLSYFGLHFFKTPNHFLQHVKHKSARIRHMLVNVVHSTQNSAVELLVTTLYTRIQAFNLKHFNFIQLINNQIENKNKRTMIAPLGA